MKVLIAGASGFIGRNLTDYAPEDWDLHLLYRSPFFTIPPRAEGYRCDLRDLDRLKDLSERMPNFDVCVYLAADTKRVGYMGEEPRFGVLNDLLALTTFLEVMKGKIKRLIYFSSGAVYLGSEEPPQTFCGHEHPTPNIPYAIMKYASELYVKYAQRRGWIENYVNVRFFGAYGPYMGSTKLTAKLIAVNPKGVIQIFGDGYNLTDVMHVEDTCRAIKLMAESDRADLTLDLCSGNPMTINDYVKRVLEILGKNEVRISHPPVEVQEYIKFVGDPYTQVMILGFTPEITLEQGIMKYYKWWFEHEKERESV